MKKTKFIAIIILIVIVIFVGIRLGLAAETTSQINLSYPWSEAKSPAGLISRFYQIALSLVGAAALGVLIYGAILWTLSGAVTTKQDALEWIKSAIWGLVLLLAAYLILYTINPELVKLKGPEELFKPIKLESAVSPLPTEKLGKLSEEEARQILTASNIGVKEICSPGQLVNCVSLEGINKTTINEIQLLASHVGSNNVYITAGTEGCGTVHALGTYSHCNGYKVDLRLNTNLNNYITKNFIYIGNRSDGAPMYRSSTGAIYALEKDHWDVLVI